VAAVLPPVSGHSTPCTAPRLHFSPTNWEVPRPGELTRPRSAWPQEAGILLDHWFAAAVGARMAGAGRFKLRFGPYRAPRFRYGEALRCEPRKLGLSPPGAGGLVGRRVATQTHIRAILAGQGLPAPRGQG